ncbi:MAG: hypothetical protein A2Z25_01190 [Planctomycetes bacterium RBG_16_55_9]|nr:MAG: hypothetical protein A2Z25_01190 [Planctomycetes bacterium RBG_16_55_9]
MNYEPAGKCAVISAIAAIVFAGPAAGRIQPYVGNPCYWEYAGRPVLLIGGSDRDNLFQWAGEDTKLTDHLDLLQSCGGNYVRCTMSSREYTPEGYRWDMLPYPFAKIDGKYDLRKWDEAYWKKLRIFLAETKRRGVIVQLEIWDRWNESGNSAKPGNGWYDSPWNPNNNTTYGWSDSPLLKKGNTGFYNAFHLAAVHEDPVLLPAQQRFVRTIVDEVIDGGFDHVLFQIDNESGIGDATLEPDPYWARFIRDYGKSKDWELYVCTSRRFHWPAQYAGMGFQDWDNPDVRVPIVNPSFNFCDISQNNGNAGQTHYDNVLWYRRKVLDHGARPINNVKCYYFNWPMGTGKAETSSTFWRGRSSPGDGEAGAKLWRAVFAGAAGLRFHRHTPTRPGGLREGFGLSPKGQTHLRSMREFIGAIHLFRMAPRNDLLSEREENEAYCLAEPGRQYAVFFTGDGDGSVRIELDSAQSTLQLRWLDIAASRWEQKSMVSQRGDFVLKVPGGGLWVAALTAANP